jgi:hypothetical protein
MGEYPYRINGQARSSSYRCGIIPSRWDHWISTISSVTPELSNLTVGLSFIRSYVLMSSHSAFDPLLGIAFDDGSIGWDWEIEDGWWRCQHDVGNFIQAMYSDFAKVTCK